MAGFNFRRFLSGLNLVPKSGSDTTADAGDLQVLSSDNKLRYNNGTSPSPVVTEDHAATLTNKTLGSGTEFSSAPTFDAGIKLKGTTNSVTIQANAGTATHTLTLPANNAVGSLTNNGAGALTWQPGGGGGSDLLKAEVTWSAADLSTAGFIKVVDVPAGATIIPEQITFTMDFNTTPWADTSSFVIWDDFTSNPVGFAEIPNTVNATPGTGFESSADYTLNSYAFSSISQVPLTNISVLQNGPLWTGGDSDIIVTLYYRVIPQLDGSIDRFNAFSDLTVNSLTANDINTNGLNVGGSTSFGGDVSANSFTSNSGISLQNDLSFSDGKVNTNPGNAGSNAQSYNYFPASGQMAQTVQEVSATSADVFANIVNVHTNFPPATTVLRLPAVGLGVNGPYPIIYIRDVDGVASTKNIIVTAFSGPTVLDPGTIEGQSTFRIQDNFGWLALYPKAPLGSGIGTRYQIVGGSHLIQRLSLDAGLRVMGSSSSNYMTLLANASAATHTLTFPANNASGALTNNGSGTLSWTPGSSGTVTGATGEGTGIQIYNSGTSTSSNLHFKSIAQGSNITLTDDGVGTVTIAATGGGGSGDVTGPSSSVNTQVPVFNGTTGKIIQNPPGSDANNFLKVDFTNTGEEVFLQSNGNHAVTYLVGNTNSGTNARAIISFGNDTGNNIFSIASTSSGYTAHPFANSAVWSSGLTTGSIFRNIAASNPPFKFISGTSSQALFETLSSSGAFKVNGASSTQSLTVNPNATSAMTLAMNTNGTTVAAFNNTNSGSSAYSEIDINANAGTLFFGHSSSGVSGTWIEGDQAYVLGNNANGLLIGTLGAAADIKFIPGGTTAGKESLRLKANGNSIFRFGVALGRETSGDTDSAIASTVSIHSVTTLTAPHTKTLPLANSVAAGHVLVIKDQSGTASTNTVTIARAGSNTIDGLTSVDITADYGALRLYSDGSSAWYAI